MVTVFNVGQGDSILLHPDFGCCFDDIPLLIDCGPKSGNAFSKISNEEIDVLITHSHNDHLGGFSDLSSKVRNLYIPYYLPEIWKIYDFVKHYLFNNVVSLDLIKNKFKQIIIISEGDELCDHLQVLNPPKLPYEFFDRLTDAELSIEVALNALREYGINLPNDKIIDYTSDINNIANISFPSVNINDQGHRSDYLGDARAYVHNFFISLAVTLINNGGEAIRDSIQRKFNDLIHRASIVFRYKYIGKGSVLFTGDADEYVFERLIGKGTDISAKYLKVPHHGSRENLSLHILKQINPTYAIISHNNRRFGTSKDTHPHYEILDYFDRLGIKILFTNPVMKRGREIRKTTAITIDDFIEFK